MLIPPTPPSPRRAGLGPQPSWGIRTASRTLPAALGTLWTLWTLWLLLPGTLVGQVTASEPAPEITVIACAPADHESEHGTQEESSATPCEEHWYTDQTAPADELRGLDSQPAVQHGSTPAELPGTPPSPDARAKAPGLRVFVDPRTGRISSQPTPAQVQALRLLEERAAAAGSRSEPQPRSFELANGIRGVYLDGAFLSATHVHRDENGALRFDCREIHPPPELQAQDGAQERSTPSRPRPEDVEQ